MKKKLITRSRDSLKLETRSTEDGKYLEGYFALFDNETELWPGAFESIDRKAFDNTLNGDIRALINHDTTLVLGRTKSGTLELETDEKGLKGRIKINENDTDALNIYERVKRGDVSGNSFGFIINEEDTEYKEDGSVKWTIRDLELFEVSVTTFPAYEETSIEARKKEYRNLSKQSLEKKKEQLRRKLDVKSSDVK